MKNILQKIIHTEKPDGIYFTCWQSNDSFAAKQMQKEFNEIRIKYSWKRVYYIGGGDSAKTQ